MTVAKIVPLPPFVMIGVMRLLHEKSISNAQIQREKKNAKSKVHSTNDFHLPVYRL